MPDSPEVLKLVCKLAIELRRRVKKKLAVREPHHRHTGGERQRQPDARHGQVFDGPVDNADVRRHRFVHIDRARKVLRSCCRLGNILHDSGSA